MLSKHWPYLILTIILPLSIAAGLISHSFALGLGLMFFCVLAFTISYLGWQHYLLWTIALALPFSVETDLGNNLRLFMPTEPLVFLALLTFLFDLILKRGSAKHLITVSGLLVLPMTAAYVISAIFSTMPLVSMKYSLLNISYILVFFVYSNFIQKGRTTMMFTLISLYSMGFAAVAIYGAYNFIRFDFNPVVIKGVFEPFYGDHTIFGATAALLSAYWLMRALRRGEWKIGMVNVGIAVFMVLAVIFSSSRAALWSLPFFMITAVLLRLRVRIWMMALMTMILALVAYSYRYTVMDELIHNRHDSGDLESGLVEQAKSVGNVTTDVSNLERLNRWIAGVRMLKEKPLFGFGPGTYQFQYIPFQEPKFKNRLTVTDPHHIPENSGGSAHSEYVLMLSETGILGLLSLLLFWGYLVVQGFRRSWSETAIPFVAMSTFFFHALFNNFLNTDKFAFLFYGMAAYLLITLTSKDV